VCVCVLEVYSYLWICSANRQFNGELLKLVGTSFNSSSKRIIRDIILLKTQNFKTLKEIKSSKFKFIHSRIYFVELSNKCLKEERKERERESISIMFSILLDHFIIIFTSNMYFRLVLSIIYFVQHRWYYCMLVFNLTFFITIFC